jgi:outer membrane biosynthesis protein TonB
MCAIGTFGCGSGSPPARAPEAASEATLTSAAEPKASEPIHLKEGNLARLSRNAASTDDLAPSAALGAVPSPWDRCPFPQEADMKDIDSAAVVARVLVAADGTAEDVEILRDPGHGFAEAARECAMKQLYVPARDADGNPIRGRTRRFLIRYAR